MSVDETKMEPLPTAVAETPPSEAAALTAQVLPSPTPVSPPPPPPPASAPAASTGVRIRPKTCDVRNCESNSLRNPEILFVSVPGHSYPERRFVWLTLMQAARDKKRSYCCSRHFKVPDDFKDFQEFISAPPGYKRQLLVKKGVVPHLNMPPLNMSALPPLTDRWPMTLPAGMTEAEQQRQIAGRSSMLPPPRIGVHPVHSHRMNNLRLAYESNSARVRYCKAVQTEPPASPAAASKGPRKVAPSLQYCRLCFQRQDLEPIFTGDQTLIEPDLIDKIFGCTEVMISVESDFPSSICTACYTSVQEFVKFRKLVQQNDKSLRGTPLPSMNTSATRSPLTPTTFIRTKTTETIPARSPLRVTPLRPVTSVSPARRREDPLLAVQRIENVEQYQRRQQTIERNQPLRAQRMQDTLYPVPYRRPVAETATSDDPLSSAEVEEKPPSEVEKEESSSTPDGVQLNDRIVPVTLIRVQPEATGSNEDVELQVPSTGQNATNAEDKSEDVTVKVEEPAEEQQPPTNPIPMNTIRAKPLHQLMASPEQRRLNPPSVLQAVKLLPSATAKALANQKPSFKPISTLTRGITSGRFPHRVWTPVVDKTIPKQSISRMFPKSLVRAVRFPGAISTLFSGARKHHKPPTPSGSPKPVASPRPAVVVPISNPDQRKPSTPSGGPKPVDRPRLSVIAPISTPSGSPKPVDRPRPAVVASTMSPDTRKPSTEKPQAIEEMKVPVKPIAASPAPKPKTSTPVAPQPKQKETSVPDSPRELTPNKPAAPEAKLPVKSSAPSPAPKPLPKPKQSETPPARPAPSVDPPPSSPRSARVRKVPMKFQDSVGFPMPKIVTVKSDPDISKVESPKVPQEKPKELPVHNTRRSNVEKASESRPPAKPDRKQPEVKNDAKDKQPKVDEAPKQEPVVVRMTRSSEAGNKMSETQQKTKPPKRKSDTRPDPVLKEAPPPKRKSDTRPDPVAKETPPPKRKADTKPKPTVKEAPTSSKPAKVEAKRNSLDTSKTKQQQQQRQQQKQKQEQRANGSRKSVPTAEVKQKKPKEPEPSITPPVSSQDWKCPFCSDKVFDQKKGLVKHLRKRHGMDYALVRQRLAIYGGNWR